MIFNADRMKAIIVSYWRYERQCPFVALEADCTLQQSWKDQTADVLVIKENRLLIETEIKLNLSDLRKDNEKPKHRFFRENMRRMPTAYFYFAVPGNIASETSMVCDEMYPYAGVLSVVTYYNSSVQVYRQPKLLLFKKLSWTEIYRMVREQSATVARLATKVADLEDSLKGAKDMEKLARSYLESKKVKTR